MSTPIRRTGKRAELDAIHCWLATFQIQAQFSAQTDPGIGDAGTAGYLRNTATTEFASGQFRYSKASTDDLWDLSGETDTTATQYRAYWLLLDSAGTASIAAGSNAQSAADTLRALPDLDGTKSVIGVYVADPSCDFDDAGGLAAQGTVYDGLPDGANIMVLQQVATSGLRQTVFK